ncbi:MAG TPA: ABC transporter permease [Chloroflexi bacterium]|nr:ABC transporter permease [Chloroflexota bacterium]
MKSLRELTHYPSALMGLAIILALVVLSIYALASMPYSEAVRLWRGGEDVWYDRPKNAAPTWTNLFREQKLPTTITMDSRDESIEKDIEVGAGDMTNIHMSFEFDYPYHGFPREISIFFNAEFERKQPHVSITWLTPDGREIRIADKSVGVRESYRISQDSTLQRRLGGGVAPHQGLFAVDPKADDLVSLQGTYTLRIEAVVFEPEADLDAEVVIYGQVHGIAGTDHRRRELSVALLWGTPIALAFGLLAAVGTTMTTMIIAGVGTWFGGWVDALIQRVTEVNLILPMLPILIMIGTFYSRSIWLMLGVLILLSIFGGAIKIYRAIFIQVKESPYIEAAQAYGAGNFRLIFRYLIPRIIPTLIPNLVTLVPTFVFIEAALALLGLGDPVLPTWGKIISDAYNFGALYHGFYYWVLEPSALLMLTALAFSLLGFSLDRIFNPRLRGM